MTALRDVLDAITSGLDWLGSRIGPLGVVAAVVLFAEALAWRLLR